MRLDYDGKKSATVIFAGNRFLVSESTAYAACGNLVLWSVGLPLNDGSVRCVVTSARSRNNNTALSRMPIEPLTWLSSSICNIKAPFAWRSTPLTHAAPCHLGRVLLQSALVVANEPRRYPSTDAPSHAFRSVRACLSARLNFTAPTRPGAPKSSYGSARTRNGKPPTVAVGQTSCAAHDIARAANCPLGTENDSSSLCWIKQ